MAKVVHFEVPFDDKARAIKFYGEAFDWQMRDMPEMQYVMAMTTPVGADLMPIEVGAINGGLMPRPQEAPGPTLYVDVPDIDAAVRRVEAAGGRVVTPNTPIPGMGAFARIADTEGNVIGLYQQG